MGTTSTSGAFNHDGTRLLVANHGFGLAEGCAIEVFELATERRVLPLDDGHRGRVVGVAAPPSSPRTLISVGVDASVRLWDLDASATFEQLGPLSAQARAVAVNADGSRVVTISEDGRMLLWDVCEARMRLLETNTRHVSRIALSPDGRFAAWAAKDSAALRALDGEGQASVSLADHTSHIAGLAFAPDSSQLFTAGNGGEVIAWSLPDARPRPIRQAPSLVRAIAVVPGPPTRVLIGCADGRLEFFEPGSTESSPVVRVLYDGEGREVESLAAMPNARAAVLRGSPVGSTRVEVWNLATKIRECVADFSNTADQASSIVATSSGQVCVGMNAGRILVLEVGSPA
jgi:WD40 repeat protein